MTSPGPPYQGCIGPGMNYSDRPYENQMNTHCQNNNYGSYQPPSPYRPHPVSPPAQQYPNHSPSQMHSNMGYNSQMGSYNSANQGHYNAMNQQDMYNNRHNMYNNRGMQGVKWGESNGANSGDMMQQGGGGGGGYGQPMTRPPMMNSPPPMPPHASMRSPPPSHYRQVPVGSSQSPSPMTWPHSPRTTPSPLPPHARSPVHTQPFSPPPTPALTPLPQTQQPTPPQQQQQPPQQPHSQMPQQQPQKAAPASPLCGSPSGQDGSDPLQSLQKMVMLDTDNVSPSMAQANYDMSGQSQVVGRQGSYFSNVDQLAGSNPGSPYPTYYNLDQNRLCTPPRTAVSTPTNASYNLAPDSSSSSLGGEVFPHVGPMETGMNQLNGEITPMNAKPIQEGGFPDKTGLVNGEQQFSVRTDESICSGSDSDTRFCSEPPSVNEFISNDSNSATIEETDMNQESKLGFKRSPKSPGNDTIPEQNSADTPNVSTDVKFIRSAQQEVHQVSGRSKVEEGSHSTKTCAETISQTTEGCSNISDERNTIPESSSTIVQLKTELKTPPKRRSSDSCVSDSVGGKDLKCTRKSPARPSPGRGRRKSTTSLPESMSEELDKVSTKDFSNPSELLPTANIVIKKEEVDTSTELESPLLGSSNPMTCVTPQKSEEEGTSSRQSTPLTSSGKKRGRPYGSRNRLKEAEKKKKGSKKKRKKEINFDPEPPPVVVKSKKPKPFNGPYIRVVGSKEKPLSVSIVNIPFPKEEEKDAKYPKPKHSPHHFNSSLRKRLGVGHTSTLSPNYDAFTRDLTWICALCQKGSHHRGLGDLFGPYYTTEDLKPSTLSPAGDTPATSSQLGGSSDLSAPKVASNSSPDETSPGRKIRSKRKRSELVEEFIKNSVHKKAKQVRKALDMSSPGEEKSSAPPVQKIETTVSPTSSSESSTKEYWIHEECIVWSHGVCLIGHRLRGLEEAVREATEGICCKCKLHGATLGCLTRGCSEQYHYLCAVERGCELNSENFSMFCPKHKKRGRRSSSSSSAALP